MEGARDRIQTDPTIIASFEEVSAKQNKLTRFFCYILFRHSIFRLNLEKQGTDLILSLEKSVCSRSLDEIKRSLDAAFDHEETCKNVSSEVFFNTFTV